MATNFPTGSDNFNVPNNPGSTALSSSGTGSRNHVQHHRDLGDAIEAMQAQATLAVHSHNSSTARHGNKLPQSSTHESADTDTSTSSLHHTLGHGANQAAPGNHASLQAFQDTHANSVSWPVGCIYISTSATNPSGSLGGTWVQVQDAFLIGVGGSFAYTGSVVANSPTHTHTVPSTSADGAHTHTVPTPTSSTGAHTHSAGTSGGSGVSHSHSSVGTGYQTSSSGVSTDSSIQSGSSYEGTAGHSHSMTGGASYSTGESSHVHSLPDYVSNGAHTHSLSGVSGSTHSHTITASSENHLPPWKAFYVWRRTA